MQKLDFERAFEVAGLYKIPNRSVQAHALLLLTEMCATALQNKDWRPSEQDREFTKTTEFIQLETKFIVEIFRQKVALMKKTGGQETKTTSEPEKSEPSPVAEKLEEPEQPLPSKKVETADWFYEVD